MPVTPRILLVEDDVYDIEMLLSALPGGSATQDVAVVGDGAEALDYMHRRGAFAARAPGHPAMVLLDLKMPRVDGLEVLRQLKTDPVLAAIPVVVFTSSRQRGDIDAAYRLGANAYVVKPVTFDEFTRTIADIAAFWLRTNQPPECDAPTSG